MLNNACNPGAKFESPNKVNHATIFPFRFTSNLRMLATLGNPMNRVIIALVVIFLSCLINAREINVTEEERESLMEGAKLGIYRSDGGMLGYVVRESREAPFKGSLLDKIGLKIGDIIIELNNLKINDPRSIRPVYETLKNDNSLRFVVLRSPSNMPLFINAELLVRANNEPNKSIQLNADASVD